MLYRVVRKKYFEHFVDAEHGIRALARWLKVKHEASLSKLVASFSNKKLSFKNKETLLKSKYLKWKYIFKVINARNKLAHTQGHKLVPQHILNMCNEIKEFNKVLSQFLNPNYFSQKK